VWRVADLRNAVAANIILRSLLADSATNPKGVDPFSNNLPSNWLCRYLDECHRRSRHCEQLLLDTTIRAAVSNSLNRGPVFVFANLRACVSAA
jgi:hypothetical protein